MYQMLDAGFVGLIFSVFNTNNTTKEQTIQVTAFQSIPGIAADALQGCSSADLEGLDTQMQAALRASAAGMQEAASSSWQRKEVPLRVCKDNANPIEVQRLLLEEEEQVHQQHLASGNKSSSTSSNQQGLGGASDLHAALKQLLHAAEQQQALLQHAECVLAPALAAMQQLSLQSDLQEQQLKADNARLQVGCAWQGSKQGIRCWRTHCVCWNARGKSAVWDSFYGYSSICCQ
eukprot:GHRR01028641.1.p1 GENE.GHRR01028641.1~~GHRR01028641.1.p1  ORF type:complete len:233 (+),score=100.35 GHRR01028641.1:115-813(+)